MRKKWRWFRWDQRLIRGDVKPMDITNHTWFAVISLQLLFDQYRDNRRIHGITRQKQKLWRWIRVRINRLFDEDVHTIFRLQRKWPQRSCTLRKATQAPHQIHPSPSYQKNIYVRTNIEKVKPIEQLQTKRGDEKHRNSLWLIGLAS